MKLEKYVKGTIQREVIDTDTPEVTITTSRGTPLEIEDYQ